MHSAEIPVQRHKFETCDFPIMDEVVQPGDIGWIDYPNFVEAMRIFHETTGGLRELADNLAARFLLSDTNLYNVGEFMLQLAVYGRMYKQERSKLETDIIARESQ